MRSSAWEHGGQVNLAKHGDADAAQAVTVALHRFADKERGKGATGTASPVTSTKRSSPATAPAATVCARSSNVMLFAATFRDRIAGGNEVQLANAETIPSVQPMQRIC